MSNLDVETLVHNILINADKFEWSLQGMGMLRLYLPNNYRLHIWDSRYRTLNVSMIHDHLQWGLKSRIIKGILENIKYDVFADGSDYMFGVLKPGYGCYFKEEPKPVKLYQAIPKLYKEGEEYSQQPNEIHKTNAENGTVTLMQKFPTDDESARVFWRKGEDWVSAEPRKATDEEVFEITQYSLSKWFDGVKQ